MIPDDHCHAAASQRADDRQGRTLIAVGDEGGYRHAASTFVATWES